MWSWRSEKRNWLCRVSAKRIPRTCKFLHHTVSLKTTSPFRELSSVAAILDAITLFPYSAKLLPEFADSIASRFQSQSQTPIMSEKILLKTPNPVKSPKNKTIVGPPDNFWLWSLDEGYDLSRPADPGAAPVANNIQLECQVSNVTIDPAKTALLLIDLQNFTLSTALRGDLPPEMIEAERVLLNYGIPAARKAGIQIVWLNWGLTDEDLLSLPPQQFRVFGWKSIIQDDRYGINFRETTTASADKFVHGGEKRVVNGPGEELGEVTLDDGSKIDAGRALFKGTWNAALHDSLAASFDESQNSSLPDVLFHKNRNSGMCETMTECTEYLVNKGIRTLLLTGMNTDQCVLATSFNAQMKGFDTILLNDGCVTDSPAFAQQCCEYQFAKIWGFLSSCKALSQATAGL